MRNIDHKIKVFFVLIASCFGLGLLTGCQHNPVYPDVGSVYIYTDPDQAEVLLDGNITHRITPVKMDGIPAGPHTFTLRRNNYKALSFSLEIKQGQTRRVYKDLSSIFLTRKDTIGIAAGDMDVSETGEIFLSGRMNDEITVARMSIHGELSVVDRIDAGGPQRLIAANDAASMVFVTRIKSDGEEEIVGIERISHKVVRSIYLRDIKYYSTLIFSPDGNILVAADSMNKKLVIIDPRLCSVIKTIPSSGSPTDISFDPGNYRRIYITMSGPDIFALMDLETDSILKSVSAGNSPGAIFWDNCRSQVGYSDRKDLTYTLVNTATWTKATSAKDVVGQFVASVCWSQDENYILWAMDYTLGTMFIPNWIQTSKIFNGHGLSIFKVMEIKMYNEKYLLLLNDGMLVTVCLDF